MRIQKSTDTGSSTQESGFNSVLVFVMFSIIIIFNYDNIVLDELIAEVWEHGNISEKKSDRERNMGRRAKCFFCFVLFCF